MNCSLRKWRIQDAADLSNALSNKAVQDRLRDGIPFPYSVSDAEEYITAMLESDPNETVSFAITVDDRVVGTIGAFRGNNIHRQTAELGYYLAEEYWNRGIVTDAVRQITDYLFANTDLLRIFATPFSDNFGSCRVLEKAGFQLEGTMRRHAVKNGTVHDMKLYALTR